MNENTTVDDNEIEEEHMETAYTLLMLHSVIASVGIAGNATVATVFLTSPKYRSKIPNIFIINQVSITETGMHG